MGHRANFVIVDENGWNLFYDHWCGYRLNVDLFWGPEPAIQCIEQRPPVHPREGWLDDIWCEGAAVIDLTKRILIWFDNSRMARDVPLRRKHLELMQQNWKGWEIRWAIGGLAEVGGYLGIEPSFFDGYPCFIAGVELTRQDTPFGIKSKPEDNAVLLTICSNEGTTVAAIDGGGYSLRGGEGSVSLLQRLSRASETGWHGGMPEGGVHVNLKTQEMSYWWAPPCSRVEEEVKKAWVGWDTKWLHDRFDEHLRIADVHIELPRRSDGQLEEAVVAHLREYGDHRGGNLALGIASAVGDVVLNSRTHQSRSSILSEEKREAVLQKYGTPQT